MSRIDYLSTTYQASLVNQRKISRMTNKYLMSDHVERAVVVISFLSVLFYALYLNHRQEVRIEIAVDQLRVARQQKTANQIEIAKFSIWLDELNELKEKITKAEVLTEDRWRKAEMREWVSQLKTVTNLPVPEIK